MSVKDGLHHQPDQNRVLCLSQLQRNRSVYRHDMQYLHKHGRQRMRAILPPAETGVDHRLTTASS